MFLDTVPAPVQSLAPKAVVTVSKVIRLEHSCQATDEEFGDFGDSLQHLHL